MQFDADDAEVVGFCDVLRTGIWRRERVTQGQESQNERYIRSYCTYWKLRVGTIVTTGPLYKLYTLIADNGTVRHTPVR